MEFDAGFRPDPESATDILAFVLCPLAVFAPQAGADELAEVAECLRPMREEAIRRFVEHHAALRKS
jgi:hypothetical protein